MEVVVEVEVVEVEEVVEVSGRNYVYVAWGSDNYVAIFCGCCDGYQILGTCIYFRKKVSFQLSICTIHPSIHPSTSSPKSIASMNLGTATTTTALV